ncbi:MAG: radical SAM protein, partial [Planctomycetota bacterium]
MRGLSPVERKWRLFRAWTSGHPIWCAWQVTYRCNYRCRFCGYWHDPMGWAEEPSVAQYADGAKKLGRMGTLMVSLAGGEPMLRNDLPELIEVIGRYHFPFMTTNGWLVTEDSARALMDAGIWGVSVSIDYASAERHDEARGIKGAWEQAWRAVELLSAARKHKFQRVNVIAVLMEDNIDDMEPLIEMAAQRGAYFMVQPYGFRKTGSRAFEHNNGPVSPRLLDLFWKRPNFASSPLYLRHFDQFLHGGVPGCKAGRAFFNIDSTGDIAICVERRDEPLANLFRDHISVIRERLRDASRNNPCTDCWYNCRGEIEGLYRPL